MNNQFATQFLREEQDEVNTSIKSVLTQTGADKDLVDFIMNAIGQGALTPERAIQIIRDTFKDMNEDGAAAPAGGSTTGGGVTNGTTFTPGNGEQYAAGTRKKKYQEDAPRLAGGKKADISTYTNDGFTKAPSAEEAGKQLKGIDVDMLWKEVLGESRAYSQFKREATIRSKPEQMHEAAKMINKRLAEISKLLEFASQMREELSEGEESLAYKHNTKKVFEKINSQVIEVYSKVKGLK